MRLLCSLLLTWVALGRAALADVPETPFSAGPTAAAKAPDMPKAEAPKAPKAPDTPAAQAEEEAERKRKEKLARVIVLKWNGTKIDHTDTTVQRNVKSRISRPEAQFFPEVDLYQEGRKVRDRTVVPAMQPAIVPDQNIQRVRNAIDEVAGVPYNAWQPSAWGIKAQELREMVELLWFVERVDLREPLFLLYSQIGRSAENQNEYIPPFYETIGTSTVNYYYYMAAVLAYQDPALLSKLTDQDLYASISNIVQMLQQGAFPTLKVDFQQEGADFNLETFGKEYEVFFNGISTEPDDQGQLDIFLGRTDIYLKRKDSGHGLSERLEVTKLEDKRYFVRDVARKKMGLDFIEELMLHPNECTPPLDGDILNYLSIYAKIHEKAEIYIAVPKDGNPNKVFIWRYDRPSATLQLVRGSGEGFPVRFAAMVAGGIEYNGANVTYELPKGENVASNAQNGDASFDPSEGLDSQALPALIPLTFEIRGHYNRLMVAFGAEAGFNTGGANGSSQMVERFFIPGHDNPGDETVVYAGNDDQVDGKADGENFTPDDTNDAEIYNEQTVNRDLYTSLGIVLGRDAGIGFGPRFAVRLGWTNLPYALQTTAHFGWTFAAPGIKNLGDRVRPFVDIDGRGGVAWPFATSLAHPDDVPVVVMPVFGITAGIGSTF